LAVPVAGQKRQESHSEGKELFRQDAAVLDSGGGFKAAEKFAILRAVLEARLGHNREIDLGIDRIVGLSMT
jgi:hypothetical protein